MSNFSKFAVGAFTAVATFVALTSQVFAQDLYANSYDSGASAAGGAFGLVFGLLYCCFIIVMIAAHVYTAVLIAKDAEQKGLDNGVLWAVLYFLFSGLALLAYLYFNKDWKTGGKTSVSDMMNDAKASMEKAADKAKDMVDGDK